MISLRDFNAHMARVRPGAKLPSHPKSAESPSMNKTESAYARHLDMLKLAGDIIGYVPQPFRLRLADRCTYTPDFLVLLADGKVRFDEVKGFLRDDASVKFKVAAELYRGCGFRMVRRRRGEWEIVKEITRKDGAK